jgi:hypothetical protein
MKRTLTIVLSILVVSLGAWAQASDQAAIDKALLAAPGNLKAAATVIKWKSDFTYDTLKKGTATTSQASRTSRHSWLSAPAWAI